MSAVPFYQGWQLYPGFYRYLSLSSPFLTAYAIAVADLPDEMPNTVLTAQRLAALAAFCRAHLAVFL
jgi:hypothetical protein